MMRCEAELENSATLPAMIEVADARRVRRYLSSFDFSPCSEWPAIQSEFMKALQYGYFTISQKQPEPPPKQLPVSLV